MSTEHQTKSYSLLRYVIAGCGWLIMVYAWIEVSRQSPGKDELKLVLVLVPSLFVIHAGTTAWVAHSKRLAARGKRGLVTRYTSPIFSRDHLGRELILDEDSMWSKEIIVSIHQDVKFYTPATEASLLSDTPDTSMDWEVESNTSATGVWG